MSYPKSMNPPNSHRVVHEAKLMLSMPGANMLTRTLTAAILESRGLLGAQAAVVTPSTAAVRQEAADRRTQAAALRHKVEELCAEAVVLRLEAEELCKPGL